MGESVSYTKQGLGGIIGVRPDIPTSDANYDSQRHEDLYGMVQNKLSPEQIRDRQNVATELSAWLHDMHGSSVQATNNAAIEWQGDAADTAHQFFGSAGDWHDDTAQGARSASDAFGNQATAAETAKNTMPPPTGFDVNKEFDKARERVENGEIFDAADIYGDVANRAVDAEAQRQQAVQVMHTLDHGYHEAASTQPSFAAPPTMGGGPAGGGGGIEGMWNSGGGGGGGVAPPPISGGGGGVSAPGGGGGGGPVPPVSPFTGGGPAIGGGGAQPLPPRAPINPPIAKPPITGPIGGGPVLPGSTSDKGGNTTRSQRPGTSSAGSRVSGGGFRSTPEGGSSSKNGPGKSGPGSEGKPGQGKAAPGRSTGVGEPNKASAIERGAAAAAGKAGKPGAGGMAPGAAGKSKEDDKERKTKYVVNDDPEETFSVLPDRGPDGESIVNPVIGEK